ncbi:unnamed protein product [Rotaria sp. Silwood1]|nr:unnamed protein product [Rotaria sp. Silwood1]CAF1513525.1 unnamed protein product [Rotaria sp. Silwood1]CAF3610396.1 unnamed protein product [Rotaria sp. Silwood1]
MQAIHEEKCTALIGAPIIFRDILTHSDRKKYDLSSLSLGVIAASPMHYDFFRSKIKVADRDGNAVPIGQQDEIWARGYPTMAGYYGDPEKIQETITPLC